MANSRPKSRTRKGRGRSRKRRPEGGVTTVDEVVRGSHSSARARAEEQVVRNGRQRARKPARARRNDFGSVGERPQAAWHPWPLSEMLILIGAIGVVVGMTRLGHGGIANGGPVLFAGLAAVIIGTLDVTWREHSAGYRSHTLILSLLPVVVFHSVVVLALSAFITVPRLFNVGLLFVDAAIVVVLFKLLRARFQDARARVVSRL